VTLKGSSVPPATKSNSDCERNVVGFEGLRRELLHARLLHPNPVRVERWPVCACASEGRGLLLSPLLICSPSRARVCVCVCVCVCVKLSLKYMMMLCPLGCCWRKDFASKSMDGLVNPGNGLVQQACVQVISSKSRHPVCSAARISLPPPSTIVVVDRLQRHTTANSDLP
jgi:hypothetical protein